MCSPSGAGSKTQALAYLPSQNDDPIDPKGKALSLLPVQIERSQIRKCLRICHCRRFDGFKSESTFRFAIQTTIRQNQKGKHFPFCPSRSEGVKFASACEFATSGRFDGFKSESTFRFEATKYASACVFEPRACLCLKGISTRRFRVKNMHCVHEASKGKALSLLPNQADDPNEPNRKPLSDLTNQTGDPKQPNRQALADLPNQAGDLGNRGRARKSVTRTKRS